MSDRANDNQTSAVPEVNNIVSTAFFTVKPISTELQNKSDVPVCTYTTGKGMDCTNPRLLHFQSIDLDTWAENSLKVIEIFFTPRFAHAVALIDRLKFIEEQAFLKAQHISADSFTTATLNARESLAKTISGLVVPTLQSPVVASEMLRKARDRYKEQILSNPGSTYSIDALVQATVSATTRSPSSPENGASPSIPVVSIDDDFVSKIDITREDQAAEDLYDLSFFVAASDKEANSSLSVLLGHSQPKKIEVPIDLKTYPPIPMLSKQGGTNAGEKSVTDFEKLTSALIWDYSYSYAVKQGAQDQIYSKVEFDTDTPLSSYSGEVTATQKLFDDLAQFSLVGEAISNDLIESLGAIDPKTPIEDPNIDRAYFALKALVQLSNNLAASWANYVPSSKKVETTHVGSSSYDFIIAQQPDPHFTSDYQSTKGESPRLLISIVPPAQLSALDRLFYPSEELSPITIPSLPLVNLEGYECENASDSEGKQLSGSYWYYVMKGPKKEYLSFHEAGEMIKRNVVFKGLDIFKTQSARASIGIIRNEHLIQSSDTAPELIYHSPITSFETALIPSFTSEAEIDISKLKDESGSQTDLANHLSNLFSIIFKNSLAKEEQISLEVNWFYTPASQTQAKLPVLKETGFAIKIPEDCLVPTNGCIDTGASFICGIAHSLKAWYTNNQPPVTEAFFQIAITVFSNEHPESTLLKFTHLVIPYATITDVST